MNENIKIVLEPRIAMALETFVSETQGKEFSGFGFVRVEGGKLVVYDYILLDVGSEGYTEISQEDVLAMSQRADVASMRLWFHRHPIGNGLPGPHNWSGMDENTIRTSPLGGIPKLIGWSAAIVRTPNGWVGRIDNHVKENTVHVAVEPQVCYEEFQRVRKLYHAYMGRLMRRAEERRSANDDHFFLHRAHWSGRSRTGSTRFFDDDGADAFDIESDRLSEEAVEEIWGGEDDLDRWADDFLEAYEHAAEGE